MRGWNPAGACGKRVRSDMLRVAGDRVDKGSSPGGIVGILDDKVIWPRIRRGDINGTTNTRTTIGAIPAVPGICGHRSSNEAREHSVYDTSPVPGVRSRLETGVAELLREV